MATGVHYWSSHEPRHKVSDGVWGGGATWGAPTMEVKGQLISAPDPLTCPDRKQRERMAELQERRRNLQALLTTRLAELRRICLQEAELTGAVPSDFPLEVGEKPPCFRRQGGTSRQGNRKWRVEAEETQRLKPKKTLFSGALRKHSDSEHNSQTHTHHGKRTVHRGVHTDDAVRSESSSASDSPGHDNDDGVSQCRRLLVSAGSPVEVLYQNKSRNKTEHPETLQNQKPPLLPPSHPPLCSQDSSPSSSDPGGGGDGGSRAVCHSDGILGPTFPPEEELGVQQGGGWVSRGTNATGAFWSSETAPDRRTRVNNGVTEGGERGEGQRQGGEEGRGGGGYSEVLLDYVWGKQLQRQQSQPSRQPITSQLYSSSKQPAGAPPTYCSHQGDQRRVTRTKSCGPFLPTEAPPTIQPDPHPHLLPPRPPPLPPHQDSQLEEATRSLHKALALEGLRDWYLRNTLGSAQQNSVAGKVNGAGTKMNAVLKAGALQRRRTTHGIIQQSAYQTEADHHAAPHHKPMLPHSATFHGHPLHGRSVDGSFHHDSAPSQKQEVALRDPPLDQPSPGTLV
ncbi:LOW QUALITY PROTEIN: uncharacterized protein ccdc120a [Leuresthes tenuis]|uniref:LOW QUALITY PROTEIN: uncharacterized protein ccdc120a n=1 Tax=Leuresthes tenuis TaxID=355514 RepID=UPI003B511333